MVSPGGMSLLNADWSGAVYTPLFGGSSGLLTRLRVAPAVFRSGAQLPKKPGHANPVRTATSRWRALWTGAA